MAIELNKGKVALVDAEDFKMVSALHWFAEQSSGIWYAVHTERITPTKCRHIRMHRLIMMAGPGQIIDHVDRDGLNNQKSNLRLCTRAQNAMNRKKFKNGKSSKYKGVTYNKEAMKFYARISINGDYKLIGMFLTETAAAMAYDAAAKQNYGEFALLNFPEAKSVPH